MMLIREFANIILQSLAEKNIFGYKSTLANQFFLLYCFFGKVYFTDKLHIQFRFIWFLCHLLALVIGLVVGMAFFVYDTKNEILMQLYVLTYCANSLITGVIFPLLAYKYRKNIEFTINQFDVIFEAKSDSELRRCTVELKRIFLWFAFGTCVLGGIFVFACIIDAMVFYDDAKVQDYTYYIIPFPGIEKYGSTNLILYSSLISVTVFSIIFIDGVAVLCFLVMCGAVCSHQIVRIKEKLEMVMSEKSMRRMCDHEEDKDGRMRVSLTMAIRELQMITCLIDKLKGLYEITSSFAIPFGLINIITQLLAVVSTDSPYAVKLKGIGLALTCTWGTLFLCMTAQMLENSLSDVSFAVYSTPWYRNIYVRKLICQFLHQTQRDVNWSMLKVYPMMFSTFSRFANFVLSTVNFLHKVSVKKNS